MIDMTNHTWRELCQLTPEVAAAARADPDMSTLRKMIANKRPLINMIVVEAGVPLAKQLLSAECEIEFEAPVTSGPLGPPLLDDLINIGARRDQDKAAG